MISVFILIIIVTSTFYLIQLVTVFTCLALDEDMFINKKELLIYIIPFVYLFLLFRNFIKNLIKLWRRK